MGCPIIGNDLYNYLTRPMANQLHHKSLPSFTVEGCFQAAHNALISGGKPRFGVSRILGVPNVWVQQVFLSIWKEG